MVTCPLPAGASVSYSAALGDLGDQISVFATAPGSVSGEEGGDLISGGSGAETLDGGPEADRLDGNDGNDTLIPGNGDGDLALAGAGDDTVSVMYGDGTGDLQDGGPGVDTLSYGTSVFGGVTFDTGTDLNASRARISTQPAQEDTASGFEDVVASNGLDAVRGSDGVNHIDTGREPFAQPGTATPPDRFDVVNPLGGPDSVTTGRGDDVVDVVDGSQDRLRCGEGNDRVTADQFDLLYDCEAVDFIRARAGGADLTPPLCALSRAKTRYRRTAFVKGVRAVVRCTEPVALEVQLVGTVKRGKDVALSRTGDLVLAQVSRPFRSGARTLKLKPSRRLLRRLAATPFRVRLRVIARDEYGNRGSTSKRIRVGAARRAGPKKTGR